MNDGLQQANSIIQAFSNAIIIYFAQIKKKRAFLIAFQNINLCF